MKEKFIRFMQGRYGVDAFSKFLVGAGLVVAILSMFFQRSRIAGVFSILGWILILYAYFRIFSKNHQKRYNENQEYLKRTSKIRYIFQNRNKLLEERKTNHIYRCPSCKQKIRVPKGKGKIEIKCPKCQTTFVKRS